MDAAMWPQRPGRAMFDDISDVPDSVLEAMPADRAYELACKLCCFTHMDGDTSRLLRAHRGDAGMMASLGKLYPHAIQLMDPAYSRSLSFITTAIGRVARRYRSLHEVYLVSTPGDELPMQIAEFVMDGLPSMYDRLDYTIQLCPELLHRSVRLAVKALEADITHYSDVPEEICALDATRDAEWLRDCFDPASKTQLARHFLVKGQTFSVAAALVAVSTAPYLYSHVPAATIMTLDAATGNQFSRAVLRISPTNSIHVPRGSTVFDDRDFCLLVAGPTTYLRFPRATRADPGVVARMHPADITWSRTLAAIPPSVLLDPFLAPEFADHILACFTQPPARMAESRIYRDMMFAHPLALRAVNEPLFRALTRWYDAAYAAVARAAGKRDLAALILRRTFGAEHLARVRAAVRTPAAEVERLRAWMCTEPPDELQVPVYRDLVERGKMGVLPTPVDFREGFCAAARAVALSDDNDDDA